MIKNTIIILALSIAFVVAVSTSGCKTKQTHSDIYWRAYYEQQCKTRLEVDAALWRDTNELKEQLAYLRASAKEDSIVVKYPKGKLWHRFTSTDSSYTFYFIDTAIYNPYTYNNQQWNK